MDQNNLYKKVYMIYSDVNSFSTVNICVTVAQEVPTFMLSGAGIGQFLMQDVAYNLTIMNVSELFALV